MERCGAPGSEVDFVGPPETVAERLGNAITAIGGDGAPITTPFQRTNRLFIVEVTEGLGPAMQHRVHADRSRRPDPRRVLRGY